MANERDWFENGKSSEREVVLREKVSARNVRCQDAGDLFL